MFHLASILKVVEVDPIMETLENQNFQRRGNALSLELSQASSRPGTHAQTHCVWLVGVKNIYAVFAYDTRDGHSIS